MLSEDRSILVSMKLARSVQKDLDSLLDVRPKHCFTLSDLKKFSRISNDANCESDLEFFKGQVQVCSLCKYIRYQFIFRNSIKNSIALE